VVRLINMGGMRAVYEARDELSGQTVALKQMTVTDSHGLGERPRGAQYRRSFGRNI